ncbi:MAG TPA: anthranilate phosphoribosyltransferase [Gammaproteobacteria bacterium]|nr:anthranilate phosphoribosyltransferase [Gammaproteobacteria bacterium]
MLIEIPKLIETLCNHQSLSSNQSQGLFKKLIEGRLSEIEISAVLTAFKSKEIAKDELYGAAKAMLFEEKKVRNRPYPIVDCCGTGGDKVGTFNISTAVSVVCSTLGLKVAKHGNHAVSSKCGSADILKACGLNLHQSQNQLLRSLQEIGLCFMYAPDHHVGLQYAKKVRGELKFRTILNVIGPLVNPMRPDYQLLGSYDPSLCHVMAQVLKKLGCQKALVIHGGGLDELATHDKSTGFILENETLSEFEITPEEVGLKRRSSLELVGGNIEENKLAFLELLKGNGSKAYQDAVAINAGALLWLSGKALTLKDGVRESLSILKTNEPYTKLQELIRLSNDVE